MSRGLPPLGIVRVVLVLWAMMLVGCGGEGGGKGLDSDEEAPPTAEDSLRGQWASRGSDPLYGPVEVLMSFDAGGILRLVLLLEGGGRLSFPGSWHLEGEELVLQGTYFEEDSRVRWGLEGDLLRLEDADGRVQEWRRDDESGG